VVDFPGVYHALLGQPCFAKFMVVPNYTYLKLKMPRPNGVITIEGSFEQAYYYMQDCIAQATALITPCGPYGSGHDTGRALAKEAIEEALGIPSIGEAPRASGGNNGSSSPSV
jgi:hypothetical protein